MSWWTNFRDSALISSGLKDAATVGAAVGKEIARPVARPESTRILTSKRPAIIKSKRLVIDWTDPKLWAIGIGGFMLYKNSGDIKKVFKK